MYSAFLFATPTKGLPLELSRGSNPQTTIQITNLGFLANSEPTLAKSAAITLAALAQVDVLKVDVDSYDCALAQALLLKVEAAVVVLESQPLPGPRTSVTDPGSDKNASPVFCSAFTYSIHKMYILTNGLNGTIQIN